MTVIAVEMLIEPGAESLIRTMGKRLKTRARSKVINHTLDHIRETAHSSDVAAWFSEERFAPARRTTVRISPDNADYLAAIAALVQKGRPAVMLDMVYFAAANMQREDFESRL